MSGAIDIAEVKTGLQDRIADLCRELLPAGRREGRDWVASNPITGDHKKEPALKVSLSGAAIGAWKDWRSSDAGDVLGLIGYLKGSGVKDMKYARKWGMDFLGLRNMSREERQQSQQRTQYRKQNAEKQDALQRKRKLAAASRLFMSGGESWQDWEKAGSGVLMPVQKHFVAYLAGRGIAIDQIEHLDPSTFRFSRSSEYWKGAIWKTINGRRTKQRAGPEYPAVLSAMRTRHGQQTACHVTFLDPLLPQKAPENPAKMMFGEAKHTFISISFGPSNKNPYIPQKPGLLAVAEGIETALTIAEAMPSARVWAAGSMSGFGNLPIDMDCVGELVICRDNNTGNDIARAQFDKVHDALCEHGKPVTVINSPVGDDFNDLAQDDEE